MYFLSRKKKNKKKNKYTSSFRYAQLKQLNTFRELPTAVQLGQKKLFFQEQLQINHQLRKSEYSLRTIRIHLAHHVNTSRPRATTACVQQVARSRLGRLAKHYAALSELGIDERGKGFREPARMLRLSGVTG